eukprot:1647399-Rhodomonas_salina.2
MSVPETGERVRRIVACVCVGGRGSGTSQPPPPPPSSVAAPLPPTRRSIPRVSTTHRVGRSVAA